MTNWIENIRWNVDGLLPVIVQEVGTAKIIMFAWMNRETLEESIKQKKQFIGLVPETRCGLKERVLDIISI